MNDNGYIVMTKVKMDNQETSNDCEIFEKEKVWPQVIAISVVSLVGISNGVLFAWPSPSIVRIVESLQYYITLDEASYFTVIPPIALMSSTIIFLYLSDYFGRKKVIMSIGFIHIIAWLIIIYSNNVMMFYLSRFLSGCGEACFYALVTNYVGEISHPDIRGTWGNLLTISNYLGQCLVNVIGCYFSIQYTGWIFITLPITFLLIFPFMPESPYFFIMQGRDEDAKATLRWLKRKQSIKKDFESLKADVNRQMSESASWADVFKINSNRRALIAVVFLRAAQQYSGVAAFEVYTLYIFKKSGGNISSELSTIIFAASLAILNVGAGLTLNTLGKRNAFFYSCLLSGMVLFIQSVYFYIDQFKPEIDLTTFNWVPLTGLMVYSLVYSIGLGILPTLMTGELFSTSIKKKAGVVNNVFFGLSTSTTTKLFQYLDSRVGLFCPFLVFSISTFISAIITIYIIPETKGKTLEEIQQLLKLPRKERFKKEKVTRKSMKV